MRCTNLKVLVLFITLALIMGCSNGDHPMAPTPSDTGETRDYSSNTTYPGGANLGHFQFLLDEDKGTVEVVPLFDRAGQKDVTAWSTIIIMGYQFNPVERNWYIQAKLVNNTQFTGWGAYVVFTELGLKNLVNQDGYFWIPGPGGFPKRCPAIAYSKQSQQRIYPPLHSDTRTIVIHVPADAPGLSPVEFFIDAWYPGARLEPYVEDLELNPGPNPGTYHISATVRDWQMPYSTQLDVVGIIPGPDGQPLIQFPLFDDGNHGDGNANDYNWGAGFQFNAPPGHYNLIVKAWDPQQHAFENDIRFHHEGGGPPPCNPIEHWPVDVEAFGNMHGEDTWVFHHEEPYVAWWNEMHGPNFPPAPIFWQYHQAFAISLGDRPTSGYWIRIDQVCMDDENDTIHVKYTEMIPSEECVVEQVVTQPHVVIGMQKFPEVPIQFHKQTEIYDCPDCVPVPHEPIEDGDFSHISEPVMEMIWTHEGWAEFYAQHKPGMEPPPFNFEHHGIAVIMLGDRETSGFWVRLDEVCMDNEGVHIRFTEMIPGPDCNVEQVLTQPYLFVAIKAMEMPYLFEPAEEIYDCPGEPDCLDFESFDNDQHSGFQYLTRMVITGPDQWETFWNNHHPNEPIPPINFVHNNVVAVIAANQPTTGYEVTIDWICPDEDPNSNGWDVHYTIHVPGENCEVDQIITQPHDLVVTEKFEGPVHWIGEEEIYECPGDPDCLDFEPWMDGNHSDLHDGELMVIQNQWTWYAFWYQHHPNEPLPQVNWETTNVVALVMHDQPSTGYSVHINDICWDHNEQAWAVDYTLEIPGENCITEPVVTQPFALYHIPATEGEFYFVGYEHVYPCND